ncbi:MAG TPA: hypothetical protein VFZ98_07820 [Vicinamibacterales bacterium]
MSLVDIKGKPIRMQASRPFTERRDLPRREALVRRIVAEFDDMPGLSLTLGQASRFLGIDHSACARILDTLDREGTLRCTAQNLYVRADRLARKVN